MNDLIKQMNIVYSCLGDDESKRLFQCRMMYALTADSKYVKQMYEGLPEKLELDKVIAKCMNFEEECVYYGAGNDFRIISMLYPGINVQCLCDRDVTKQKNGWNGITVISPEELIEKKKGARVVIVTTGFHKEIKQYLITSGVPKNQIVDLGEIMQSLYNRQYFEPDIILPSEEEIFIDGGCYDCSTSQIFIQWCNGNYSKIYGFEPDESNYIRCLKRSEQMANVTLFKKGLWDCEEQLTFASDCGQGSKITNDESGKFSIMTTSIDAVIKDEKVTFIKLDVEGAELKALQGACNTILNNRPKLAISIYHKAEDIFEIPKYILSLHSDYKLYIRHYQFSDCETILYAI